MKHTPKNELRQRRHARVRARVIGTRERPRLAVFKSNRFVVAQLIDDEKGHTLASAHGREFKASQVLQATKIGEAIAKRAKEAGISAVVFDRGGYRYAAQIKALADAARAGGLVF
ncbi:50S ribosomal protein L18 [Candidatus Kaiserbacteria bacterium RIFCSPLOWO2_02_FULL_56_11]|uniref:Large ribosomal subunit protein uL18 n=2 Tax=Candidatus Kaiseribacteriota TaxID=1752734 RepID=A0A1F6E1Y6_9BACT|nr:MAG: 50S ribosomal protein L18 [Candidatus Kaiserbacteria bacterium RIFCSPHIGHO2_02_FULL_56_30]OGG72424.1 MAG: 50S ribosomal protein L18 [Candidatus Kaiserbacteria bacterium RIFCSPHIGHO2_12_FULL_56_13]OGG82290.1 MAG: 50S ribosomal protein L18 [Candidatus Kaiserbacteria bacterium RIFCSPLOWO2_02_FULL_56_11]